MNKLSRRRLLQGSLAGSAAMIAGSASAIEPGKVPEKWDETVDVVIVGSGGAGLSTAVSARENGVTGILILEKMAFIGGNTNVCGGGFNSSDPDRQPKQGIEDSPELHIQQTLRGGDGRANPELVRTLCENSYETIKWLEKHGMKFRDKVDQLYGGLYPRGHSPAVGHGNKYIEALNEVIRKTDGIEIRLNSRVTDVIREKPLAGAVLGVEYRDREGKLHYVRARKAVVAAAGGFGGNPEMRAKFDARLLNLTTTNIPGTSTGDLIVPLQNIGADTVGMDHIQCNPGCPPGRKVRVALHLYIQYILMVDKSAKRFVREDERRDVIRDAILALPDQTGFSIMDQDGHDRYEGHPTNVDKGLSTGDSWTADTIEELAGKMGLDPKALRKTVDTYNSYVDSGRDEEFGRAPRTMRKIVRAPFWAGYSGISVHHTMGGVRINRDTQVLDRNGEVIPHLHAVGEVTGGIHGSNRLGGNAIADIFTFGRLTGIAIAQGK